MILIYGECRIWIFSDPAFFVWRKCQVAVEVPYRKGRINRSLRIYDSDFLQKKDEKIESTDSPSSAVDVILFFCEKKDGKIESIGKPSSSDLGDSSFL